MFKIRPILAFVLIASAAGICRGDVALDFARAFVDALNSGDVEQMTEYQRANRSADRLAERSAEQRGEQMLGISRQFGALTLDEVLIDEPERAVIVVGSAQMGVPFRFELPVEDGKVGPITIQPYTGAETDMGWLEEPYSSLDELVARAVENTDAPAVAAAVMQDGELVGVAVAGVREIGSDARAVSGDAFHIGSISKSFMSTVIGSLIDQGLVDPDSTLADLLPDIGMHESYRAVTLRELLQHRAGVPSMTAPNPELAEAIGELPEDPVERRAAFAAGLLSMAPASEPGSMVYSNGGYGIASHIAEKVSGKSWEMLITEVIFEPLAFERGGFGWPNGNGLDGGLGQPRGHVRNGENLMALPEQMYSLPREMDAAGNIHCTVRDLVTYGEAHRKGLAGERTLLEPATFALLHTPAEGGDYACGWSIDEVEGVGTVHQHNGSAGTFYAQLVIEPETGRVIAIATNIGLEGQPIAEGLIGAIRRGPGQ